MGKYNIDIFQPNYQHNQNNKKNFNTSGIKKGINQKAITWTKFKPNFI